jgi:hypothetical protein
MIASPQESVPDHHSAARGSRKPATIDVIEGVGTPGGRPGAFVEIGPRPPLPADVYAGSYYRFPLLRRDELDVPTREMFDRVVGADRTAVPRGPALPHRVGAEWR